MDYFGLAGIAGTAVGACGTGAVSKYATPRVSCVWLSSRTKWAAGQYRIAGLLTLNGRKVGRAAVMIGAGTAAMGARTIFGRATFCTATAGLTVPTAGKPEGMTASLDGADKVGAVSQAGGTVGAASKSTAGFGAIAETGRMWSVDADNRRDGGTTRGKASASVSGPP